MGELFGCYVSASTNAMFDKTIQEEIFEKGRLFRNYIFGENSIKNILKKFTSELYGNDIKLILFEFYINPIEQQLEYINKGIRFKKKEKAIGIPIVVTDNLFFDQPENKRMENIIKIILEKLNNLSEYVKTKKINLKIDLIINELHKEWNNNLKK